MIRRLYSSSSTIQAAASAAAARLSPAARHILESKALDSTGIVGTSRGGIISKADVLNAISSGVAKPLSKSAAPAAAAAVAAPVAAAPASIPKPAPVPSPVNFNDSFTKQAVNDKFKDVPLTNMRKVIAKRLTESKATVPHGYTSTEINIDALLNLRKQLKKEFDINVSVNDIVIKCAALALRDLPEVNGKWNKTAGAPTVGGPVDISIAVATPTGLITPIVFNADKKSVVEISNNVRELANRAKEGKLKPEEYQGGSFSISNLGMFGITSFSAVINPPQACILAVGAGVARPAVPRGDGDANKLKFDNVMTVQLSADRRVVDEAQASHFLQVFQSYMADPKSMML